LSQATAPPATRKRSRAEDEQPAADTRRLIPLWSLYVIAATAVGVVAAARPLSDPDIWWHIRLGRQILANHALPHVETWSFTAAGLPWRPTAWLSDVVIGATYNALGYRGIIVLKLGFAIAVLAVLAWTLVRQSESRIAAIVFTPAAITLVPFLSERPQVASFLFVLWVGRECRLVLSGGRVNPLKWGVLVWLWANVHGMWFIAPAFLGAAIAFRLIDESPRDRAAAIHNAVAAAAAVIGAALTPVGPRLVIQPLLVVRAAHRITEWQRTALWEPAFFGFLVVLIILIYAWARQTDRIARSEILWAAAVFLFSLVAARDVPVATLLLAPVAARAVHRLRPFSNPEATAPASLAAAVAGICLCLIAAMATTTRTVSKSEPVKLATKLTALSGGRPVSVINDYDVGGYLVGTSPYIRVGLDGRTDTYNPHFVDSYLDMLSMQGAWRATWEGLIRRGAEYAVLGSHSALADIAQRDYHWAPVERDGDWLLLAAPGARPAHA
jgi:hypothetical protein